MFFDPKIDVEKHDISSIMGAWGALGSIFLVLGGFGTGRFFDGFRDQKKKRVQNPEKYKTNVPRGDRGEMEPAGPTPRRGEGGEANLPPGSEG